MLADVERTSRRARRGGRIVFVLHWWFVTLPLLGWHTVTLLSFARLLAGIVLALLYAVVTLSVIMLVLRAVVAGGRAVGRGAADGWRPSRRQP